MEQIPPTTTTTTPHDDCNSPTTTPDDNSPYTTDDDGPNMAHLNSGFATNFGVNYQNYPPMGFTENLSATYLSSGNPCLDLFFHVVPHTPSTSLTHHLQSSWSHDPLTTLKLISNLRGVRGTGKSDKENFYNAALWLHKHHPLTLSCNVSLFAEFGYFKDLPEILLRLLEGPEIRETRKREWGFRRNFFLLKKLEREEMKRESANTIQDVTKKRLRTSVPQEKRVEANMEKVKEQKENARVLRKEREFVKAKKADEMYNNDTNFQFLHDSISTLFAQILKSDVDNLASGEMKKISLAAKWCPSIDSSYDKSTLICKNIARRIFPSESYPEYEHLEEADYVYSIRNRLRKEVLVPLHKALKLPEVYMSARQWGDVPYDLVASVAMANYTDIFLQRDKKRFRDYLENVKVGNAKITAGALLPHEIIASVNKSSGKALVSELQWKRMVEDLVKKGMLSNCIAVSDVSGSMTGTPMEVSVALGLLVSELSEKPWKGRVITFSENPELHLIKGGDLKSKTRFIREMYCGFNTDFQKVFDRILEVAVNEGLSQDQMIKRVFVFSDMEFDQASENPWETDYQAITRKFNEKGYEKVPEIVFWNLRYSSAIPVTATQSGVALVSGFSKNLLTLFLEQGGVINLEDVETPESGKMDSESGSGDGKMNPEDVMKKAISGELYDKLVVYD